MDTLVVALLTAPATVMALKLVERVIGRVWPARPLAPAPTIDQRYQELLDELRAELARAQVSLEGVRARLDSVEQREARLADELRAARQRIRTLETDNDALRAEVAALQARLGAVGG